jgi:hypothetical protein
VSGHDGTTPVWSSVTATFVSGTFPVFVTTYVHVTASSTGTNGPGGAFASAPSVNFRIVTAGAGAIRFTIVQVTIALAGAVPLKPFAVALKPGSGVSLG